MERVPQHQRSAFARFLPKYLYALGSIPFLFTAGALSPKHRFLIFQIAHHFGMNMRTGEDHLPEQPLSAVFDKAGEIVIREPLGTGGNVTLLELTVIATLARSAPVPTGLEIGTFDGRTTMNIAANLGPAAKVFTLDLPKEELGKTKFELESMESGFVNKESSGSRFTGTDLGMRITQLYGDSAAFDFSPYEGSMGLVFIDGSHAYDYVLQDTATALRLVAPGGIIIWHDYQPEWPGVISALNQLYDTDTTFKELRHVAGTSLAVLRAPASSS